MGDDEVPTLEEAEAFLATAEARLLELVIELSRNQWVQANFITEDTDILAARAYDRMIGEAMQFAKGATRFDGLDLPYDVARKLKLLKVGLTLPAPSDAAQRSELTQIAAGLESAYGRGKYCPQDGECQDLGALSRTMASSRNPDELLEAWVGWRTIAPPMREDYRRFAELGNKGASELGFRDLGALWRSQYDMDPDAFRAELDRLWGQVRPLYESLHCYVRGELNDFYTADVVPPSGSLPAHVLGNMWAQTWSNIYDIVAPPWGDSGFDLSELLQARKVDAREMVRYGESFFTSLGFEPLPDTFWERSLFTKPADREVVCHASAWDIDQVDDLRIKMCIEINAEDFSTVHHELGHSFYQRAYSHLPFLYRESANDGFHEGVGDTVALSVTPEYLVQIGLLDEAPDESADLGVLLRMALDKVAFLPFGLVVDQWRWKVFSGEVDADEYNAAWWALRQKYQGITPPVERSEKDFDPGAKYHVPANTPYTRYFLAHILQFQFQRALCNAAGYEGPLHRCSIYGNPEAGKKLIDMLEMGSSRPWPDALEAVTGQREMDATAILDYFAPLKTWLDERNAGRQCGW
ncbi:MAG: M2 family metallopeptidase [Acidobacteriota bacterium]|nr:M2 family metallopeptidase [Acidobacteriota bacterium]